MDLNKLINEKIESIINESLPSMVEDKVKVMVNEVLKDIFSYHGEAHKEIKKTLEHSLNVNLQAFKLQDFNSLVVKIIEDNIIDAVNTHSLEPIKLMLDKTFSHVNKKSIKLSEIYEMVSEAFLEDNYEISFTFLTKRNISHEWLEIFIDEEAGKDYDNCALSFIVSTKDRDTKRIFAFRFKDWFDRHRDISFSRVTRLSGIEREIFRLYSAQIEIEIDETDFDGYASKYD